MKIDLQFFARPYKRQESAVEGLDGIVNSGRWNSQDLEVRSGYIS